MNRRRSTLTGVYEFTFDQSSLISSVGALFVLFCFANILNYGISLMVSCGSFLLPTLLEESSTARAEFAGKLLRIRRS